MSLAEQAVAPKGRTDSREWLNGLPLELEYTGEFGAELVLFLPFVNWLSREGLLRNRAIKTYRGMRCFYDDLECREIVEKDERRKFVRQHERPSWLPVKSEHRYGPRVSPFHLYPDLRRKFLRMPIAPEIALAEKPLLILHNKATTQWGSNAGVNVIPIEVLDAIFATLKASHTIVYIRHGRHMPPEFGYSRDHQIEVPFEDGPVLDRHPEVLRFSDIFAQHRRNIAPCNLNTFKSALYARCHRFISSQGGGTMQIAMFSGSLLAVLHRHGHETAFAYDRGYFGFCSDPPPELVVCRDDAALMAALPRFAPSVDLKGALP